MGNLPTLFYKMKFLENIKQTSYTASVDYALSKADAKLHLNILDTSFDDLIDDYLAAAHQMLFAETGLLLKATATGQLDVLCDFFIDIYNVDSIVIKYYNASNVLTVYDAANYILNGQNVEIIGDEPTTYDRDYPYVVEITTAASSDPMNAQCLRMIMGDLFESRQTNVMGSNSQLSRTTKWQLDLVSKRVRF